MEARWKKCVGGHLRKSLYIGSTNAHASKTTKRGAADFVVVLRGANLGQSPGSKNDQERSVRSCPHGNGSGTRVFGTEVPRFLLPRSQNLRSMPVQSTRPEAEERS